MTLTDNDRLLELARYCRHDYYVAEVSESSLHGKHHYHHRMGCHKCGPHPISRFSNYAEPYQTIRYSLQRQELIEQYSWLPPVGDGHIMDLGEMFHLANNLNEELWGGKAMVCTWTQGGIYKASVQIGYESWEDGDDYYESDPCDTPEAALSAAILAALYTDCSFCDEVICDSCDEGHEKIDSVCVNQACCPKVRWEKPK